MKRAEWEQGWGWWEELLRLRHRVRELEESNAELSKALGTMVTMDVDRSLSLIRNTLSKMKGGG